MLRQMAERVAKQWAADSDDPVIKALPNSSEWESFFDIIFRFIEKLMPLLDMCPMDPERMRRRAARWAPCTEMSFRQKRREISWIGALMLSNWQDEVDAVIGPRMSEGFNNEEFQAALLKVASVTSDGEMDELRALAKRAKEAA